MRSKSAEPMAQPWAGAFDHKETTVDLSGLGNQFGQVLEPGADPDVGWLVDHGLDT